MQRLGGSNDAGEWGLNIKNKWKYRVTEMVEGYRPHSRLEAMTRRVVIFCKVQGGLESKQGNDVIGFMLSKRDLSNLHSHLQGSALNWGASPFSGILLTCYFTNFFSCKISIF